MEKFTFVVFGFTSNLAQLKIIPALYDLEQKGLLSSDTRVVGIGRKNINLVEFINETLKSPNRHHTHPIDQKITNKLISRIEYLIGDFDIESDLLFKKLKTIKGNILYYLATYPNLYHKIFKSIKDNQLNLQEGRWVRMMIEKPIGSDFDSARDLNNVFKEDFSEDQIFRVDHYLGKETLRKIFGSNIDSTKVQRIDVMILENFGIGKRGVYYDATGSLIDMGQNHLLQMVAAICAKSASKKDREYILDSLLAVPKKIVFGQYSGYLNEENINSESTTDTFFALKTELSCQPWKNIPIYMYSGKKLARNVAEIKVYFKDETSKNYVISPTKIPDEFDPYERLILDAVNGDQTFFNSESEVLSSWKFIDELKTKTEKPFIYEPGSEFIDAVTSKLST